MLILLSVMLLAAVGVVYLAVPAAATSGGSCDYVSPNWTGSGTDNGVGWSITGWTRQWEDGAWRYKSVSWGAPTGGSIRIYVDARGDGVDGWNNLGVKTTSGTYAVPSGWRNSIDEVKICGTPTPGTIIVDKVTVPPTGNDPNFKFEADYIDRSGADFELDDNDTPRSDNLAPGTYQVEEYDLPSGWVLTSATCSDGSNPSAINLSAGEVVTCTFTNTKKGKIIIDKVTVPPTGNSPNFKFEADYIDKSGADFELDDNDTPRYDYLLPGVYRVDEIDLPEGWVLESAVCDDGSPVSAIDLSAGEWVTCTFTNRLRDPGELTIVKVATPEDETPFPYTGSITTPGVVAPRAAMILDPFVLTDPSANSKTFIGSGNYEVTEGALPAGWRLDDVVCEGTEAWSHAGPTLAVTVEDDEEVTCYFYNSGHGRIIVNKVVSPADAPAQSFGFTPSWGPGFPLAGGGSHDSGLLPAGIYGVSEVLPLAEGWSLASSFCSDGSSPAAIGLSPGETVTCTFNNRYQPPEEPPTGSLTILKMTTPAGGTGFLFDGTLGAFTLDHGGSQLFDNLAAGDYAVSETPAAGWVFEDVTCYGPAGAAANYVQTADGVVVSLAEGEDVTCKFANRQEQTVGPEGSLTIIKKTVPAGGTGFGFDAGALGAFTLDDGGMQTFTDLEPGAYVVSETPAEDWQFASIECSALDYVVEGASVTVNLAEGEAAVCTFTNGELPYTGSNPFTMPLLIAGLWALLMGLALGVWSLMREADKA